MLTDRPVVLLVFMACATAAGQPPAAGLIAPGAAARNGRRGIGAMHGGSHRDGPLSFARAWMPRHGGAPMQGPGRSVLRACAGLDTEMRALNHGASCRLSGPDETAALVFISYAWGNIGYAALLPVTSQPDCAVGGCEPRSAWSK